MTDWNTVLRACATRRSERPSDERSPTGPVLVPVAAIYPSGVPVEAVRPAS